MSVWKVFQLTHDARAVFLFQLEALKAYVRWFKMVQEAPPGAQMLDVVKESTKQLAKVGKMSLATVVDAPGCLKDLKRAPNKNP